MPADTAPVLLFVYKRHGAAELTINALKQNYLANQTDLYIFSDGPKHGRDAAKVEEVRNYLSTIAGFKSVTIKKAEKNKGLATSIVEGVTEVLKIFPSCIVLEDDLLTSENFLNYMNSSLQYYSDNKKVFSISGFTFPVEAPGNYSYDGYFNPRGCSWGWATWADRWFDIDWKLLDNGNEKMIYKTKSLGSDFPSLIKKYRERTIDSWAIPWCYYQYKHGLASLYPVSSKVKNIGFDPDATHTLKTGERFVTILDDKLSTNYLFSDDLNFNTSLSKQYTAKFSYYERLKWRLLYEIKKISKKGSSS
ncbi:MAG: sugar transferase [Ginsengibacter sp.]